MTFTDDPIQPLWTRARAMFARAVAAVGTPAALAAIALLSQSLRRDIVAWLSPLEHIVRKLLLAEAAELRRAEIARIARAPHIERIPLRGVAMHWRPGSAPSWTAGLQSGTGASAEEKSASEEARSEMHLVRPETWRARFSFALPRNPHTVPNARAPRILDPWGEYPTAPTPPRTPSAFNAEDSPFRLARRFEALRRVLENPRPHAERLARVLVREARRIPRLVMRYLLAGPRTDAFDPADSRLSVDAMGAAFDAPDVFADSS